MTTNTQISDAMVEAACDVFDTQSGDFAKASREAMRAALSAALAAMWRTDFENAPFMEPVALTIQGRKLPIAVFRYNAKDPWRYLESGKEVDGSIVATRYMPLPAPPAQREG